MPSSLTTRYAALTDELLIPATPSLLAIRAGRGESLGEYPYSPVSISASLSLASGNTLAPTIDAGVNVSVGLVTASGNVYSPSISIGTLSSPSLVVASGTVFSPVIDLGHIQPVSVALASGLNFSPTLSVGIKYRLNPNLALGSGQTFGVTHPSSISTASGTAYTFDAIVAGQSVRIPVDTPFGLWIATSAVTTTQSCVTNPDLLTASSDTNEVFIGIAGAFTFRADCPTGAGYTLGILGDVGQIITPDVATAGADTYSISHAGTGLFPAIDVAVAYGFGENFTPRLSFNRPVSLDVVTAHFYDENPTVATVSLTVNSLPALYGAADSHDLIRAGGPRSLSEATGYGVTFNPSRSQPKLVTVGLTSASGTVFTPTTKLGIHIKPTTILASGHTFAPSLSVARIPLVALASGTGLNIPLKLHIPNLVSVATFSGSGHNYGISEAFGISLHTAKLSGSASSFVPILNVSVIPITSVATGIGRVLQPTLHVADHITLTQTPSGSATCYNGIHLDVHFNILCSGSLVTASAYDFTPTQTVVERRPMFITNATTLMRNEEFVVLRMRQLDSVETTLGNIT